MAQVGLQGAGIMALVGQRKATGVSQHVRVSLEAKLSSRASTLHKPAKARSRERPTALACEHEG